MGTIKGPKEVSDREESILKDFLGDTVTAHRGARGSEPHGGFGRDFRREIKPVDEPKGCRGHEVLEQRGRCSPRACSLLLQEDLVYLLQVYCN